MKQLSDEDRDCVVKKGKETALAWIKAEDDELDQRHCSNNNPTIQFVIGFTVFFLGLLASALLLKEKSRNSLPVIMSVVFYAAPPVLAMVYWIYAVRRALRLGNAEIDADIARLEHDPLYIRAEFLARCIRDYSGLCLSYQAWSHEVERNRAEADEELAERAHEFIVRSREALERAIDDFKIAVSFREKSGRQKLLEERVSPGNDGLADLVSGQQPAVEIPPELGFLNHREKIGFEVALADLSDELEGGESRTIVGQIESKCRQAVLSNKTG
jgi:hypothetical protein